MVVVLIPLIIQQMNSMEIHSQHSNILILKSPKILLLLETYVLILIQELFERLCYWYEVMFNYIYVLQNSFLRVLHQKLRIYLMIFKTFSIAKKINQPHTHNNNKRHIVELLKPRGLFLALLQTFLLPQTCMQRN